MIAEADRGNAPLRINEAWPGSDAYLVDSYEVPGAFTKAGSAYMVNAFKTVDRFLGGEGWVMGGGTTVQPAEKAKIVAELRARYAADYANHWRRFLRAAS